MALTKVLAADYNVNHIIHGNKLTLKVVESKLMIVRTSATLNKLKYVELRQVDHEIQLVNVLKIKSNTKATDNGQFKIRFNLHMSTELILYKALVVFLFDY